jgi:hypothetical protein
MSLALTFQRVPSIDATHRFTVTLSNREVIECSTAEQACAVVEAHLQRGQRQGVHHQVVSAVHADPEYRP